MTVTNWIRRRAQPVTTVDRQTPLTDLTPLRDLVRDATVVGLGVSARGTHELSNIQHRLLRFLVEEVGFRALVLEEDWTAGLLLDEYVRTGAGDPAAVLAEARPFWRTAELLDGIRWLRRYNLEHADDPVRLVGLDCIAVRASAYDAVLAHVRNVAPDRTGEIESLYAALRPAGAVADHVQWYRNQVDKQPFVEAARRAEALVGGLPAGQGGQLAVQHARAITGFYEFHLSGSIAEHEVRLAATAAWWHEQTGQRIAYFGGMAHTAVGRPRSVSPPAEAPSWTSVGGHLRDWLGPGYVSIGLTFDHGAVPFTVPPAPVHFAEAAFERAGLEAHLLGLHVAPASLPAAVRTWLATPTRTRLIGPSFDPDDNAAYYMAGGSLVDWFDAIVHVRTATPTHPLTGPA